MSCKRKLSDECSSQGPSTKMPRNDVGTLFYPDYLEKLITETNLLRFEQELKIKKSRVKIMELRIISSVVKLEKKYFNDKIAQKGQKLLNPVKNLLPKFLHITIEENHKQRLIHRVSGDEWAEVKYLATKSVIQKLMKINEEKNKTLE
ncbi:uncharacterized protein LOC114324447 [Diabrotica virgifera virgifera]|uniref:Uncharacterized protein LOC114324447 n=1 Tax=Diabrotica virgifera virgifera TaxID=50390 RepID=A0A6P7F3M5_DIAVI|nr:uncharacterized protein LOC114324447 [Diabrotica virgifera virgifera]